MSLQYQDHLPVPNEFICTSLFLNFNTGYRGHSRCKDSLCHVFMDAKYTFLENSNLKAFLQRKEVPIDFGKPVKLKRLLQVITHLIDAENLRTYLEMIEFSPEYEYVFGIRSCHQSELKNYILNHLSVVDSNIYKQVFIACLGSMTNYPKPETIFQMKADMYQIISGNIIADKNYFAVTYPIACELLASYLDENKFYYIHAGNINNIVFKGTPLHPYMKYDVIHRCQLAEVLLNTLVEVCPMSHGTENLDEEYDWK